jgi:predicted alpha-1,2-mannosidase
VSDRGFTGFPRPKVGAGEWLPSFTPQGDDGFHEGTAWQYQWLVQQDVAGLVERLGGPASAAARLDDFFAYPDLVADPARTAREKWVVGAYEYYNQFRYNPNNEPDLHAPWMYVLVGQPWKTSAVVRAAQTLFVDGPAGVTGNDDLGQMSAWYVLSALGLYPVMPGTGQFLVHAPRFERAVLRLRGGDVVVSAEGADPARLQYVRGFLVDGVERDRAWVEVEELTGGGVLEFLLTEDAEVAGWATGEGGAPPSPLG